MFRNNYYNKLKLTTFVSLYVRIYFFVTFFVNTVHISSIARGTCVRYVRALRARMYICECICVRAYAWSFKHRVKYIINAFCCVFNGGG